MKRILVLLTVLLSSVVLAPTAAPAKRLQAGDVPTVTLAPVAARVAGTYQSATHTIPAGHYDSITITLVNAGGANFSNDTGFVQGDELDGVVEISEDAGATWVPVAGPGVFLGGNPSPRTHGYSLSVLDIDINPNTIYRGRMTLIPGVQGAKITLGVQGTATLGT